MPLTMAETVALSDEVIELVTMLAQATAQAGPGGRKVTKAEAVRLVDLTLELSQKLVRDIVD